MNVRPNTSFALPECPRRRKKGGGTTGDAPCEGATSRPGRDGGSPRLRCGACEGEATFQVDVDRHPVPFGEPPLEDAHGEGVLDPLLESAPQGPGAVGGV